MSLPQYINFRASSGYVTDGADTSAEVDPSTVISVSTYPRTTAQGNNVGWEITSGGPVSTRDRSASNNVRLAGVHYHGTGASIKFRIDLPSAGSYDIRGAFGEQFYSWDTKAEIFDTTTSLGVLFNGVTGAGNSFFDAAGAIHTAANWPANNTAVSKTFSTTMLRVAIGSATQFGLIAHLGVEGGASGPSAITAAAAASSVGLAGASRSIGTASGAAGSSVAALTGSARSSGATSAAGSSVAALAGSARSAGGAIAAGTSSAALTGGALSIGDAAAAGISTVAFASPAPDGSGTLQTAGGGSTVAFTGASASAGAMSASGAAGTAFASPRPVGQQNDYDQGGDDARLAYFEAELTQQDDQLVEIIMALCAAGVFA